MFEVRARIGRALWIAATAAAFTACTSETLTLDPGPSADAGIAQETSEICGDGRVTGSELCEDEALQGTTCEDFGFKEGELRCAPSCAGFLVEKCTGVPQWASAPGEPCLCGQAEICVPNDGANICLPICFPGQLETPLVRDVYRVRVSGRLTSNGASIGGARGKIFFSGLSTVEVRLIEMNEGAYEALVPPGDYRVYFAGGNRYDLPDQEITLLERVTIDRETSLDLELPPLSLVEVRFSTDGGQSISANGIATLTRLEDPLSAPYVINSLSDWSSGRWLLADGTYEVRVTSSELFTWHFDQVVATVDVDRDDDFDIEIPSARLMVNVRANHQEVDGLDYRFKASLDGRPIEPLGPSLFSVFVPAGGYTLITQLDHQLLGGRAAPDDRRVLQLDHDQTITIDFDAPTVRIQGTISGAPPLSMLRFQSRDGVFSRQVTITGGDPPRFDAILYPETYRISFEQSGLFVTPDELVVDRTNFQVELEASAAPPPDAQIEVHGALTINGEPIRDNTLSGPRGHLQFRRLDGIGSARAELPGTGPAEYRLRLDPGAYEVAYEAPWGAPAGNISQQDAIPPHPYVLRPRIELQNNARRDFDFKVLMIEGSLNGGSRIVLSRYAGSADSYYDDHREYRTLTERATHFRFDVFPGEQRLWIDKVADAEFYPGALERRRRVEESLIENYNFDLIDFEITADFEGGAWPGDRPAGVSVFGAGGSAFRTLDENNTARFRVPRFMSGVTVEGFLISEPCAER